MSQDPQITPRDFSESIQELRDEMRRDVRNLSSAIERRPKAKPGVSPLGVVASVLGSLFVGAAGMSLYDSWSETSQGTPKADIEADVRTFIAPYTQQLDKLTQSLVAAQQATTDDLKAQRLLVDRLAETLASLDKSTAAQSVAFHERLDLLADELADKIAAAPTVAARPPFPDGEPSSVQPASAETDVSDPDDSLVEVEKTPAPVPDEPERGELVINNPSRYDLKLLINDEPVEIKAGGVTTIDVPVGTIKTQIASIPDLVQDWDKWDTVDGVPRLTINVESGNGYYQLK